MKDKNKRVLTNGGHGSCFFLGPCTCAHPTHDGYSNTDCCEDRQGHTHDHWGGQSLCALHTRTRGNTNMIGSECSVQSVIPSSNYYRVSTSKYALTPNTTQL